MPQMDFLLVTVSFNSAGVVLHLNQWLISTHPQWCRSLLRPSWWRWDQSAATRGLCSPELSLHCVTVMWIQVLITWSRLPQFDMWNSRRLKAPGTAEHVKRCGLTQHVAPPTRFVLLTNCLPTPPHTTHTHRPVSTAHTGCVGYGSSTIHTERDLQHLSSCSLNVAQTCALMNLNSLYIATFL